jgi:hypothetical protein
MLSSEREGGCEHSSAYREECVGDCGRSLRQGRKLGLWLERESGKTATTPPRYPRFPQAGITRSRMAQQIECAMASRGKSEDGAPSNRVFPN